MSFLYTSGKPILWNIQLVMAGKQLTQSSDYVCGEITDVNYYEYFIRRVWANDLYNWDVLSALKIVVISSYIFLNLELFVWK